MRNSITTNGKLLRLCNVNNTVSPRKGTANLGCQIWPLIVLLQLKSPMTPKDRLSSKPVRQAVKNYLLSGQGPFWPFV